MLRKNLLALPLSRLARRIVLWVFVSVILIETLIFIPSYRLKEKELLEQMRKITAAHAAFVMQIVAPDASNDEFFSHIQKLSDGKPVVGGALYTSAGTKIGSFGEVPKMPVSNVNPARMTFLSNRDGSRYDIAFSPVELKRDFQLILRTDSSFVRQDLFSYFLRIAGLVFIISLVVTVGTWLPLQWIVVNPVLNLRNDLIRAGFALSQDQQTPEFYSANVHRSDELGEVIRAFRQMYRQISDAITKRKKAENHLINNALEAGMAQMSAMILHNIGNAVTPILVQMEWMRSDEFDKLHHYLSKSYPDLEEHAQDLTNYTNADPRGREVFSYMGNLIDALKSHGDKWALGAEKIEGGLYYISEIISLQQAYTTMEQETKELTDLNQMIMDAIRIQTGTLEKNGIMVKEDLDPNLPKILIDKSRLMQVIVNLIKNSYEAIGEVKNDDRAKVIEFNSFAEDDRVRFEARDNGIGIDPQLIDTIVLPGKSHKGSSGFGLYYCKMFVEANNGTIRINSPGVGKGATVSIEFKV